MSEFEALYKRYAADVFRFALYLCGDRAEAEDIAALRPTPLTLPRDSEMETLLRTQQLLSYRRSALLLFLCFFAVSAYLRLYRTVTLSVAILSFLTWLVLGFFGRHLFRLPRR